MTHWLIRLHADDAWEEWGRDWWHHCDRVAQLQFVAGHTSAPAWVTEANAGRRLDWGAWLHELTLDQVRTLVRKRPRYDDAKSDRPLAKAEATQNALLASLDPSARYGVVRREDS